MLSRKKWFGVAILMLVAAVLITGCSGNSGNNGSSGESGNNEGNAPAPKENEASTTEEASVNLVWYTIGTPPKDLALVNEEINKYIKDKINATVDLRMLDWGEYTQKMQVISASGENYDIAFTSSWAFDYFSNAAKGAFYEIDTLLDEKGQGIKGVLNPAFLEGTKVNGHNYGMPTNKELPQQRVFRFNKTYLDKHNLDISNVRTLQDLEPILKSFKEKESGIAPIPAKIAEFLPFDLPISDIPFIGMPLGTTDYKLINVWETQEAKAYLETIHSYYKAGYLPKDVAVRKDAGDYFKTGKWLVDVADSQPYAENLWSSDAGYEVVIKPMHDPITFNWSVAGAMQAINANSKNPAKAMEFMNLLYTDEYLLNLIDFGIEGKHYNKIDAKVKESIPDSGYGFPAFSVGNLMLSYLNPTDPQDKWNKFAEFNNSATNAPLLGFQADTSNITSEIASLKNAKDAAYDALFSGTLDPAKELERVNQNLKTSGLDKVIADIQKQIDEWVANK